MIENCREPECVFYGLFLEFCVCMSAWEWESLRVKE